MTEINMRLTKKITAEIDKPIRKVIILLNKKGFKTTACCSGHSRPYRRGFSNAKIHEAFLTMKYQAGQTYSEFFCFPLEGYISFEREKDTEEIFSIIEGIARFKMFKLRKASGIELHISKKSKQNDYNIIWNKVYEILRKELD